MISSYTMELLLAPSDKVVIGKQTLVRKVQTFKNGSITFPQSNITQDLEAFTVNAAKGFRYALPSWAYSFAGERSFWRTSGCILLYSSIPSYISMASFSTKS